MKLYEVNRNTYVRLPPDTITPVSSRELAVGEVVKFLHVDGMYSYCITEDGDICHPAAWTEVEIVSNFS